MKKMVLIFILLLFTYFNIYAGHKHFYLHGFGNDIFSYGSQTTEPLGLWINTNFKDFNDNGKHIQWTTPSPLGFSEQASYNVIPSLNLNQNEDQWVGIGYSAGGLLARSASLIPSPASERILAYVTIGTPNIGTFWASGEAQRTFIRTYGRFGADMKRGKYSFVATLAGNYVQHGIEYFMKYLTMFHEGVLNFFGPTRDMQPNSSYLSNINSQSNVNTERALKRGRGIVWGLWDKYCFPAGPLKEISSSANSPIESVQEYQNKIDEAWKENQYHNQMVHKFPGFFQYGKRVWHRSRAGDWTAVRNAYFTIENEYKLISHHNKSPFGSDAFIAGYSQRMDNSSYPPLHDPNYSNKDKRQQIHGFDNITRITHGEMVGQLLPNGGFSNKALERVLRDLGYD